MINLNNLWSPWWLSQNLKNLSWVQHIKWMNIPWMFRMNEKFCFYISKKRMLNSILLYCEYFFILTWCKNSINFFYALWFINGCFEHVLSYYIIFLSSLLIMNASIRYWHPTILKLLLIEMDSIKVACNIIKKIFIPFNLVNRFLYFGHITKWTTLVSIYHINRLDYIFLKSLQFQD